MGENFYSLKVKQPYCHCGYNNNNRVKVRRWVTPDCWKCDTHSCKQGNEQWSPKAKSTFGKFWLSHLSNWSPSLSSYRDVTWTTPQLQGIIAKTARWHLSYNMWFLSEWHNTQLCHFSSEYSNRQSFKKLTYKEVISSITLVAFLINFFINKNTNSQSPQYGLNCLL